MFVRSIRKASTCTSLLGENPLGLWTAVFTLNNTEKSGFIHLSAKVEEEICLLKTHTQGEQDWINGQP